MDREGVERKGVLAVEEDRRIRQLIRVNLEADGLRVCEAESEHQCLEVFQIEKCQVLLLSLDTPGLDVLRMAREIRARGGANLPLLLISAEEPSTALLRALQPALYIKRPFDAIDLARCVKELLGRNAGKALGG